MSGYSKDLRERIVQARANGKRVKWIAETFGVSVSSMKRYVSRYKQSGTVAATVQRRTQPRISADYEPALRALVQREPEARLDQYCVAWQAETGIVVSIKTMSQMLVRLGLRRKKDSRRS
jgi:transposase